MADKEPVRTCVACGERAPKGALLRLGMGPDGVVALDLSRRGAGRGAHVHPTKACLTVAGTARALGRAFKGKGRAPPDGVLLARAEEALGPLPPGEEPKGRRSVRGGSP